MNAQSSNTTRSSGDTARIMIEQEFTRDTETLGYYHQHLSYSKYHVCDAEEQEQRAEKRMLEAFLLERKNVELLEEAIKALTSQEDIAGRVGLVCDIMNEETKKATEDTYKRVLQSTTKSLRENFVARVDTPVAQSTTSAAQPDIPLITVRSSQPCSENIQPSSSSRQPARASKRKSREDSTDIPNWPHSPKKPRLSREATYENTSSLTLQPSSPISKTATTVAPPSTHATTSVHLPPIAVTPQDPVVRRTRATRQHSVAAGAMDTPIILSDDDDHDDHDHDHHHDNNNSDNDDSDYVDSKVTSLKRRGKKREHKDDSDRAKPQMKKKKTERAGRYKCLYKGCNFSSDDLRTRNRHIDTHFQHRFTCPAPNCGYRSHRGDVMITHFKREHGDSVPDLNPRKSVWVDVKRWPKELRDPLSDDPIYKDYLKCVAAGGSQTDEGPVAGPSK